MVKILSQTSKLSRRLFLSSAICTVGISLSQSACQNQQQSHNLRIGINDWIGYALAQYTKEAGIFEQRGLTVDLIRFINLQDAARAMLQGALDATFSTIWDLMQTDPSEDEPVVILVVDISHGSDGIVVRPPWQSLGDLKGKKVGAKLGTINHLILLEALNLKAIPPEAVMIEDLSNQLAAEQLKAGKLDGAVLWQPLLREIATAINGKIVYSTKDTDSLVVDVLAVRKQVIEQREQDWRRFLLAWFDTMAALENQPQIVFEYLSKALQRSVAEVIKDYQGLKPGTIALNQRMFGSQQRLAQITEETLQLLKQDPRHQRIIRESLAIDSDLITQVIKQWKAE